MKNLINARTRDKYNTALGSIAEDKPTIRSTTGVRGVYFMKNSGKYQARIQIDKVEIILINTRSFKRAIRIRKRAEEKYYKPIIDEAIKNGDFAKF